jgi:hypothetical protein
MVKLGLPIWRPSLDGEDEVVSPLSGKDKGRQGNLPGCRGR